MFCGQCGASVPDYAIYCGNCGARRPRDAAAVAAGTVAPPWMSASEQLPFDRAPDAGAFAPPFRGGRIDWMLVDVLFGVLCFLALFLLLPIPFVLPFLAFGEESTEYYAAALVAGAGSELGLIAVAVFFTFRKYGGSWPRLGFSMPTWPVLGYAVAAVVAAFLLAGAYSLIVEFFDIEVLKPDRDDQLPDKVLDNTTLMIIAGIVTIGFAPVCEEIFFRGFVVTGMFRAWGAALAIMISGLVFSGAHIGPNMHKTLVPIFIIGAVFAFAYWRSGNILSVIAAHMLFNAISFAGLAFSEPEDSATLSAVLSSVSPR